MVFVCASLPLIAFKPFSTVTVKLEFQVLYLMLVLEEFYNKEVSLQCLLLKCFKNISIPINMFTFRANTNL